jgi:hypothetical protein
MAVRTPHPPCPAGQPRIVRSSATGTTLAAVDLTLKIVLLIAMLQVLADPGWAHLDGKAPVARSIVFPLWALAVPCFWAVARRPGPFPWGADVLVTLTCLVDVVGNRLDLYDSVTGFDDWVHFGNSLIVSVVYVVLTVDRHASLPAIAHAAVAAGLTASLAWELFEYGAFLVRTTEWASVYSDTVGDLLLGWLGSLAAVAVLAVARRRDIGDPRPRS